MARRRVTVRKQKLLTTAVLLACAVVLLFGLRYASRSGRGEFAPASVPTADVMSVGRNSRHLSRRSGEPMTGIVYTVADGGQVVRNGFRPILSPASTAENAAEEAAEAEWESVVSALERPAKGTIGRELQARFRRSLGQLPKNRRTEALQTAMNLIPDENSAVVVGLVFDRSQPEEIVNLAFSNVLNRSDEIKADVIRRVARDRTHPNYVEAARLNDILCLGSHKQR